MNREQAVARCRQLWETEWCIVDRVGPEDAGAGVVQWRVVPAVEPAKVHFLDGEGHAVCHLSCSDKEASLR